MRRSAVAIALAVGLPVLALAEDELLPPPPPPPAYDGDVPLPPPPSGARRAPSSTRGVRAPPRGAAGRVPGRRHRRGPHRPRRRSAAAPPGRDGRPLALRDGERRRGPVRRQAARRRPREPRRAPLLRRAGGRPVVGGLRQGGEAQAADVHGRRDRGLPGVGRRDRGRLHDRAPRVPVRARPGRGRALPRARRPGARAARHLALLRGLAAAPRRHDAPLLLRVAGGGVVRPLPRRRSHRALGRMGVGGRTSRSRRARGGCAGRCSCRRPCCSRCRAT